MHVYVHKHILYIIHTQLSCRTHLHFMVLILKLQLNLFAFCCRIQTRLCAMFHLIVGQYVLALPMYFIQMRDQVHSVVGPASIFNRVFLWRLLHIQAVISTK